MMPSSFEAPQAAWREHLLAALALACVALAVFWPLTLHPTEVLVGPQRDGLNDLNTYYIPSRQYAIAMHEQYGEFPMWNPHVCMGVGYVGNPQSALYYPPNWICFLVDASIALSWLLVVHHWWVGFGAYMLLRSMGCRWAAALFAGLTALAAPYWLAHTGEGHYAQICAVSWIPWGLLAYASVRRGDRFALFAMACVLVMSFFCNHVQETYYLVLALSLFVAADALMLAYEKDLRQGLRLIGRWIVVGILTAGVVAIDLIPIQIYSYSSMRAVFRHSDLQIDDDRFLMQNFTQLLDPYFVGTPATYDVHFTPYCEMSLYFGVTACVLAGVGIVGCRSRPGVMRLTLLLLGTFLFALGRDGPLFSLLYDVVPGIAWFRGPSRALFFTQFLIALLAGLGVDAIIDRRSSKSRGGMFRLPLMIALAYGVVASVLIAVMAVPSVEIPAGELLQRLWQRPMLWFWLVAPALVIVFGSRWRPCAYVGVLSVLVLAESISFANHALVTLRPIPLNESLVSNTEPFPLGDIAAVRRKDGTYPRVVTQQFLISDERAVAAGIHRLRGYDPLMLTYYFVAMLHLSPDDAKPIEQMGFWIIDLEKMRLNLVDLFGVKYAVWPQGNSLTLPEGWTKRWSGHLPPLVARTHDDVSRLAIPVEVWENANALPRAFIVGEAEEPLTFDDLNRQLDTLDPRKTVLLNDDVLPDGPRSEFRAATVTAYSPNRVEVHAELDRPGYLVLTDLYHPGWSATVNGQPAPILLGDLAFRVVPLEAGSHDVVFTFRPLGYRQGKIITLMTLAVALVLVLSGLRKRRGKVPNDLPQNKSAVA